MTAKMVELRKGKMDEAACREALKKNPIISVPCWLKQERQTAC